MQVTASWGKVIVADGSTELRKKFPAALFREQTRYGPARRGMVMQGKARCGSVKGEGALASFPPKDPARFVMS